MHNKFLGEIIEEYTKLVPIEIIDLWCITQLKCEPHRNRNFSPFRWTQLFEQ